MQNIAFRINLLCTGIKKRGAYFLILNMFEHDREFQKVKFGGFKWNR